MGGGSRSVGNEANGHFIKVVNAEAGLRVNNWLGVSYEFRQALLTPDEQMRFNLGTLEWYPLFDHGAANVRLGGSFGTASVHAHPFVDGFHDQNVRGTVPAGSVSLAFDRYGETLTFSPFVNYLRTFGNLSSHTCLKGFDANGTATLSNCADGKATGIGLIYVGVALSLR
jgi:hypothetical protein